MVLLNGSIQSKIFGVALLIFSTLTLLSGGKMKNSEPEEISAKDIHSIMSELVHGYPERSRILDIFGQADKNSSGDRVYIVSRFRNIGNIMTSFKKDIFRLHASGIVGLEVGDLKEYFDKFAKPDSDVNGRYSYLFTTHLKSNTCSLLINVPTSSQNDHVRVESIDIFCSYEEP